MGKNQLDPTPDHFETYDRFDGVAVESIRFRNRQIQMKFIEPILKILLAAVLIGIMRGVFRILYFSFDTETKAGTSPTTPQYITPLVVGILSGLLIWGVMAMLKKKWP